MILPDAFIARPWGYLGNQSGHVALGAGLAWLLGFHFGAAGIAAAIAICAAIEIYQIATHRGLLWDSAEDLAFEVAGVAAVAASPWALAAVPLFLAAGALRRIDEREA